MLSYLIVLISGFAQPTQTSLNSKLSERTRSPLITTIISFALAFCGLGLVLLLFSDINIPVGAISNEPAWILMGGPCGTAIVMLSVICLPQIGSAMTVVLTSFGQMATSLIIDQFGIFNAPQISMSMSRIIGSLLLIGGVVVVSRGDNEKRYTYPVKYMGLAFLCGVFCGSQVAINGSLGTVVGSGMNATLISMFVGLIATCLLTLLVFLVKGRSGVFIGEKTAKPFKWYMALGGLLGVVVVGGNAIVAPIVGTGMVTVMNLVGFTLGGLLYDAIGFLGFEKKPVTVKKIIGVVVMIIGTAIITLI